MYLSFSNRKYLTESFNGFCLCYYILYISLQSLNLSTLIGIDVGDQFYSRAEMVALGIHSHWLNGIDYMGVKYQDKVNLVE